MTRSFIRPFWLVGATLMVADAVTTYLALSALGPSGEGNPLAVWAIEHFTLAGMCIAKAIIGVLMVYRLAVLTDRGHRFEWMSRLRPRFWKGAVEEWRVRRSAAWALAFTCLLMGLVVGNNIRAVLTLSL